MFRFPYGMRYVSKPSASAEKSAGVPAFMKTDVKEAENGYEVAIDLPGYTKEDVKAELKRRLPYHNSNQELRAGTNRGEDKVYPQGTLHRSVFQNVLRRRGGNAGRYQSIFQRWDSVSRHSEER